LSKRYQDLSFEVVAIGRANIDVILRVDKLPTRHEHIICQKGHVSFGGSAANFAAQSVRLGVKTGLVCCVGNDLFGQMYLRELARIGVDTGSTLVLEDQPTGVFVIATAPDDDYIVMVEPGANRFLEKHVLEEEYLAKARTIHIAGGLPMTTIRAAEIATTEGMVLSLDPGKAAEAIDYFSILRYTDLLFVNEQELREYFKVEPTESGVRGLAKTFPGVVIVKMGHEGAIATDGFEFCTSQAFDVPVADTTGAGDAFAAGFVTAWTRSEKIEQALHMANAVAALKITKLGAQNGQPTLEETAKLLNRHGISIDPVLRSFETGKREKPRRK
jgi:ribokinase